MGKSKIVPTSEQLQSLMHAQVDQWKQHLSGQQSGQQWENHLRSVVVDLRKGADSQPTIEEWNSLSE